MITYSDQTQKLITFLMQQSLLTNASRLKLFLYEIYTNCFNPLICMQISYH